MAALAAILTSASCSRPDSGRAPAEAVSAPWFEEVARLSGIDFIHDSGHRGRHRLPEAVCGGCAIFDYDGDGWMDVYCVQSGPLGSSESRPTASRLFRNKKNGTFEDVTAAARVGSSGYGIGCACGDYDGDGDVDLFVSNLGPDVLYRNEGNGTFSDVTAEARVTGPGFGSSAAFVDYDQDGSLDLAVVQYINWSEAGEISCPNAGGEPDYCKPDNYRAPSLPVLYRNKGAGVFEDVTTVAGLGVVAGNGLGIGCADFNGDGLMDLYVANDGDPNRLWINEGKGRFTEQALLLGCAVSGEGVEEAGMGVAVADLSHQSRFDILVTNFAMETHTLYRNAGDGQFDDRSVAAGLAAPTRPFTGFGVGFHDFDHDGAIDIYVANGRVEMQPASERHVAADRYAEPDQLFRGVDGGRFAEVFPRGGTAELIVKAGRGAAFGDLDNDGDVDIVVMNRDAHVDVLRNVAPKRGGAVTLRVLDAKGADAIGALVAVRAGNVTRSQFVMPSYGYCSSNDPRLHFGLGGAAEASEIRVRWINGKTETFGPLAAGRIHEVREGTGR